MKLSLLSALAVLPISCFAQNVPPSFQLGPDGTFGGAGAWLPKTATQPADSSFCIIAKGATLYHRGSFSLVVDGLTGMEFNHSAATAGYGLGADWCFSKPTSPVLGFINGGIFNAFTSGQPGRIGAFLGVGLRSNPQTAPNISYFLGRN